MTAATLAKVERVRVDAYYARVGERIEISDMGNTFPDLVARVRQTATRAARLLELLDHPLDRKSAREMRRIVKKMYDDSAGDCDCNEWMWDLLELATAVAGKVTP